MVWVSDIWGMSKNVSPAPPVMIVVDSDGELVSLADSYLSASPAKRRLIGEALRRRTPVCVVEPNDLVVVPLLGDGASAVERLAALFSASPGRSVLLDGPPELLALFDGGTDS